LYLLSIQDFVTATSAISSGSQPISSGLDFFRSYFSVTVKVTLFSFFDIGSPVNANLPVHLLTSF